MSLVLRKATAFGADVGVRRAVDARGARSAAALARTSWLTPSAWFVPLEAVENEKVVRDFLHGKAGEAFKLEASVISQPWVTGHDGVGAFRLRRKAWGNRSSFS